MGRRKRWRPTAARVYTIRPKFIQPGQPGGINGGNIQIEGFIELHDPDKHIPFAITN
jgi:glycerophosphoryl diester phosphodiesterase